jgi:hypothetical protein
MIGQGGLGYTFGPLDGTDNEFRAAIKQYPYEYPAIAIHVLTVILFSPLLALPRIHWPSQSTFFPLLSKVFPARILIFLGESVPWPALHHLIKVLDNIHMHSRVIYEKKASLMADGDADTMTQLGKGKDILNILGK